MTTFDNTVVPKPHPLAEEQFRARFLQALNRLCGVHGDSTVALWLGVSDRQLRNIKSGALPSADKIFNLLAYDTSAHDELDAGYGRKGVPASAACTSDPVAARMAGVLTKAIQAESPNSPGGEAVTLHEILDMDEVALRHVNQTTSDWIVRLDEARGIVRIPYQGKVA